MSYIVPIGHHDGRARTTEPQILGCGAHCQQRRQRCVGTSESRVAQSAAAVVRCGECGRAVPPPATTAPRLTATSPRHHHRAQLRPGAGQLPVTTAGSCWAVGRYQWFWWPQQPQCHADHSPTPAHCTAPGHTTTTVTKFCGFHNHSINTRVWWEVLPLRPCLLCPAHTNQRGVAGAGQDAAQRRPLLLQHVPLRPARPQPRPRARRAARRGEPASPSRAWHVPPRPRPRPPPRPRPAAQPAAGGAAEAEVPVQDATSCAKPEGKIWNRRVHEATFPGGRGKRGTAAESAPSPRVTCNVWCVMRCNAAVRRGSDGVANEAATCWWLHG